MSAIQLNTTERKLIAECRSRFYTIMEAIILALGFEQASLSAVRQELERKGKLVETVGISAKRVVGLRTMADTLMRKMDRQRERALDTESAAFRAYFRHVMSTFKEALSVVGARPELTEAVFSKFAAMTTDPQWEAEAKARIRQAT